MRARSSALATIRENHFISTAWRSLAVFARQAGQALSAAAIAASLSAPPRLATSASFRPVAGSLTSKRAVPATHSPPMRASVLSRPASLSAAMGEVFMSIPGSSWAAVGMTGRPVMVATLPAAGARFPAPGAVFAWVNATKGKAAADAPVGGLSCGCWRSLAGERAGARPQASALNESAMMARPSSIKASLAVSGTSTRTTLA